MKEFEVLRITEEDTKRSSMYLSQKKRKEFESKVGDFNEFLKEMNILQAQRWQLLDGSSQLLGCA